MARNDSDCNHSEHHQTSWHRDKKIRRLFDLAVSLIHLGGACSFSQTLPVAFDRNPKSFNKRNRRVDLGDPHHNSAFAFLPPPNLGGAPKCVIKNGKLFLSFHSSAIGLQWNNSVLQIQPTASFRNLNFRNRPSQQRRLRCIYLSQITRLQKFFGHINVENLIAKSFPTRAMLAPSSVWSFKSDTAMTEDCNRSNL